MNCEWAPPKVFGSVNAVLFTGGGVDIADPGSSRAAAQYPSCTSLPLTRQSPAACIGADPWYDSFSFSYCQRLLWRYVHAASLLFNMTLAAKEAGDPVPLWGTCMGLQTLSVVAAGHKNVLTCSCAKSIVAAGLQKHVVARV